MYSYNVINYNEEITSNAGQRVKKEFLCRKNFFETFRINVKLHLKVRESGIPNSK